MDVLNSEWPKGPANPKFNLENELHIWSWQSAFIKSDDATALFKNLSHEENLRANRFRFERDKQRFLMARSGLKEILSRYLDIPAQELEIEYSNFGKPYLKNKDLFFNLSHSNDHVLCAVSQNKQVGIDLEFYKADLDFIALAEEFCTAKEYQFLITLSEEKRKYYFYQYWTRKEALVKAMGQGLFFSLKEIEIDPLKEVQDFWMTKTDESLSISKQSLWTIYNIDLNSDCGAALAIEAKELHSSLLQNIHYWSFEYS